MECKKLHEIVMTDEQIREAVQEHLDEISVDRLLEMMEYAMTAETEEEKEILKQASSLPRIIYTCFEMYKLGFMYGIYNYNETMKGFLEDQKEVLHG